MRQNARPSQEPEYMRHNARLREEPEYMRQNARGNMCVKTRGRPSQKWIVQMVMGVVTGRERKRGKGGYGEGRVVDTQRRERLIRI
jgi:hypothetical protein